MAELSPQQQRVRDYILEYQTGKGRRPTYEQIGAALGMAKKTVCKHVKKLEKRGEIALLYQAKATGT